MRWIFFGSNGVRAGWRILTFLALVAIPIATLVALVVTLAPKHMAIGFPHYVAGIADPLELGAMEAILLASVTFATVVMARLERRASDSYGVPWRLAFGRDFWGGVLWGFGAISLAIAIIVLSGGAHFDAIVRQGADAFESALLWGIAVAIVGVAEESLFRGYVQHTLGSSIGFWPSAVVVSLLFLAFHLGNAGESVLGLSSILLFGLFFCLTLWLTGNLWFAIGFHAAWDWGQSFFYGVPDSGLVASHNFLHFSPTGPQWLSGGTAGPEASVACFVSLLVASALLWKRKDGNAMRSVTALSIAVVLALACAPAIGMAGASCSGHVTTGQTDSEATIRRLEHDWSAAYWSGDTAYLKCLYDPQMQSINAKGRRTTGAQDIAGAVPFVDPKKRLTHTSTIVSLDVVVHGWFAVATGVTQRKNVTPVRRMRWSDVYVFDGTRWHAIFSQDTRVQ